MDVQGGPVKKLQTVANVVSKYWPIFEIFHLTHSVQNLY